MCGAVRGAVRGAIRGAVRGAVRARVTCTLILNDPQVNSLVDMELRKGWWKHLCY